MIQKEEFQCQYGYITLTMASTKATLQCIEIIKKRSRAPSAKKIEAAANSPPDLRCETKARQKVSKNKLYDIEIVQEDQE